MLWSSVKRKIRLGRESFEKSSPGKQIERISAKRLEYFISWVDKGIRVDGNPALYLTSEGLIALINAP